MKRQERRALKVETSTVGKYCIKSLLEFPERVMPHSYRRSRPASGRKEAPENESRHHYEENFLPSVKDICEPRRNVQDLLFGAEVPFVLRPQADGSYRLCYVQGIMNGKETEMWRNGKLEKGIFTLV